LLFRQLQKWAVPRRRPAEIAAAMRQLTFTGDMQKHLLFSVVTAVPVNALGILFGVDENTAIV
jgi:hypothetical protein